MLGKFISFEGGEGSGKSTQVRLLAERLRADGREVVVTREPGGGVIAERIRAILLDDSGEGLSARAEALLFAAARAQHVSELIRPALERGAIVITDRYLDSSVAYQGAARGLGVADVKGLSLWATENLLPDVTVLLKVSPEVGLDRARGRSDVNRLDMESSDFHARVDAAFTSFAAAEPDRFAVVDANGSVDQVQARVWKAVSATLR